MGGCVSQWCCINSWSAHPNDRFWTLVAWDKTGLWNSCIHLMALHGVWSFDMGDRRELFTLERLGSPHIEVTYKYNFAVWTIVEHSQ